MTNYGTIKIPEPAYERHNDRRKELGLTWEQYVDGESPEMPNNAEEIVEQLKNELSMANDPGVEVDVEKLYNRIDDLQSQLPKQVAEELR